MVRYISLNSRPGIKSSFSVQRSAINVEKGFSAEEASGQVFHSVVISVASHTRQNIKLRT